MQPEVLKAIGAVIGIVLSIGVLTAVVRIVLFFGELRATVGIAGEALSALQRTLQSFTEEVSRDLRDHEGRIRVLEDREGVR